MRLYSVWLPALAISASLSVATASATCVQGCIDQYEECSSSCSQCFCQDDYNACTAYCETSDWDEDGITEPNDNCPDDYNPNQADCDSDGVGDVCDGENANWVEIEDLGACDWDGDLYFDVVAVEIYSAKRWLNTCSSAVCTDVYRSELGILRALRLGLRLQRQQLLRLPVRQRLLRPPGGLPGPELSVRRRAVSAAANASLAVLATAALAAGCSPVRSVRLQAWPRAGRALSIAVTSNNPKRMVVATETGGFFWPCSSRCGPFGVRREGPVLLSHHPRRPARPASAADKDRGHHKKPGRLLGDPNAPTERSHINFCVFDSGWESSEAFALDHHPQVAAWAKNEHLGFEVHYLFEGGVHRDRPDFLVRLKSGVTLVLETKGQETAQDRTKRDFLAEWVAAVNEHGGFGRWACDVSRSPSDVGELLARLA